MVSKCSACKIEKDHSEFHKSSRANREVSYYCKECSNEKSRAHGKGLSKERIKSNNLKRCYGITYENYQSMLNDQDGKCLICNRAPYGRGPNSFLAVDHCHDTGAVRGLLCSNCNRALGMLKENEQTVQNMLVYIKMFNKREG